MSPQLLWSLEPIIIKLFFTEVNYILLPRYQDKDDNFHFESDSWMLHRK